MRTAVIFDTPNPGWMDADFKAEIEAGVAEAEYEVAEALMENGHDVYMIGLHDDLRHPLHQLEEYRPELVFNCCESFMGNARYDYGVPALLELHGYRYTGSPPEGLVMARDKAASKKVLAYHSVKVPDFEAYDLGIKKIRPPDLDFPLIVKPLREDASVGIAQSSVVSDEKDLVDRVEFIHRNLTQAAIAEQFIEGREFYIGMLGNQKLIQLPTVELIFEKMTDPTMKIATHTAKWDLDYRERWGIKNVFARPIGKQAQDEIERICPIAFHALRLRDYGRIDVRLTPDQEVYVLEVNPNPYISYGEDMANAADKIGLDYYEFIERIAEEALARYEGAKA